MPSWTSTCRRMYTCVCTVWKYAILSQSSLHKVIIDPPAICKQWLLYKTCEVVAQSSPTKRSKHNAISFARPSGHWLWQLHLLTPTRYNLSRLTIEDFLRVNDAWWWKALHWTRLILSDLIHFLRRRWPMLTMHYCTGTRTLRVYPAIASRYCSMWHRTIIHVMQEQHTTI
jgi:hypothetical protein